MKKLLILMLLLTACKKEPIPTTQTQQQAPSKQARLLNITSQNVQWKEVKVNNVMVNPPLTVCVNDILSVKYGGTPGNKSLAVDVYIDGVIIDGTKKADSFERIITIQ